MSKEDYRIKIGSKVKIYWTDGSHINGELRYMPQATGDLLHIVDEHGKTKYINTGCTTFKMMIESTQTNEDK